MFGVRASQNLLLQHHHLFFQFCLTTDALKGVLKEH